MWERVATPAPVVVSVLYVVIIGPAFLAQSAHYCTATGTVLATRGGAAWLDSEMFTTKHSAWLARLQAFVAVALFWGGCLVFELPVLRQLHNLTATALTVGHCSPLTAGTFSPCHLPLRS